MPHADAVTRSSDDCSDSPDLSEANDLQGNIKSEYSCKDVEANSIACKDLEAGSVAEICSPLANSTYRFVHFYEHVPNGDNNNYEACKKNVAIDPDFQAQLQ